MSPPPPGAPFPPPPNTHTLPVRWVWVPPSFVLWGGGLVPSSPASSSSSCTFSPCWGWVQNGSLSCIPSPHSSCSPYGGLWGLPPKSTQLWGLNYSMSLCAFLCQAPEWDRYWGLGGGGWVSVPPTSAHAHPLCWGLIKPRSGICNLSSAPCLLRGGGKKGGWGGMEAPKGERVCLKGWGGWGGGEIP